MKIFLLLLCCFFFSCKTDNDIESDYYTDEGWNEDLYSVQNLYSERTEILLDKNWKFADFSRIDSGKAVLYKAVNRNMKTVAINAGHGTRNGNLIKTLSHPDGSPKLTGGTTAKGSVESTAVSTGMSFKDGTKEAEINLRVAKILRRLLLENGYDVLMIRESEDVQLDNIARTVIANNNADIHIAIHFDGDGKKYDKGCFYCGTPEKLAEILTNVKSHRNKSERLGKCLINGLESQSLKIYEAGREETDLTQTSYSEIPTADIELGNQCTVFSAENLEKRAKGIFFGIENYFSQDRGFILK